MAHAPLLYRSDYQQNGSPLACESLFHFERKDVMIYSLNQILVDPYELQSPREDPHSPQCRQSDLAVDVWSNDGNANSHLRQH